jgi:hypothetical protein
MCTAIGVPSAPAEARHGSGRLVGQSVADVINAMRHHMLVNSAHSSSSFSYLQLSPAVHVYPLPPPPQLPPCCRFTHSGVVQARPAPVRPPWPVGSSGLRGAHHPLLQPVPQPLQPTGTHTRRTSRCAGALGRVWGGGGVLLDTRRVDGGGGWLQERPCVEGVVHSGTGGMRCPTYVSAFVW